VLDQAGSRPPVPVRPDRPVVPDATVRALLALLVVVLALPYGVRGPGWFREDWISLDHAAGGGPWAAAGPLVSATRPGVVPVYAVSFGLLGRSPLAAWVLLVASVAVSAVLVHIVARRWLDPARAGAVAAVWVVLPTHASLTHWASATHIVVALILTLAGVLAADRCAAGEGPWWPAALALVGGGLTYESFLPAALVAVAAIGVGRRAGRAVAPVAGAVGVVLVSQFVVGFVVKAKAPAQMVEVDQAVAGNLGWGLTPAFWWPALQAVLLGGLAVALARLALPSFRPADPRPERLVAAGAVLVIAGLAPFLPFGTDIDFTGLGDRANALPSLGVAGLVVGLGDRVVRSRPVVVALVAAGLAVVLPTRLGQDDEWSRVARRQEVVLDAAAATGRSRVTVGPDRIGTPAVEGLNGWWDGSAALRWWTGDRSAELVFDYAPSGPVDVDTSP
jgi:hypothetical protein